MHAGLKAVLAFAALICADQVTAQTITISPSRDPSASSRAGKRETIRVTVSVNSSGPISSSLSADELEQLSSEGRRRLYQTFNRECAALQAIYKGDCRLVQITVNVGNQDRVGSNAFLNVSGNANFELTLEDQKANP